MAKKRKRPYLTAKAQCPICGEGLQQADNLMGEGRPTPGCFTLCTRCGAVLLYEAGMTLTPALDGELHTALTPGQLRVVYRAQKIIRSKQFQAMMPPPGKPPSA
jgi:hypothetical protein